MRKLPSLDITLGGASVKIPPWLALAWTACVLALSALGVYADFLIATGGACP